MIMKDKPDRGPRAESAVTKPGEKAPKTRKDVARARKMSPGDFGQVLSDHLKRGGDGGPVAPGDTPGYGQGTLAEMPVVVGPKGPRPQR